MTSCGAALTLLLVTATAGCASARRPDPVPGCAHCGDPITLTVAGRSVVRTRLRLAPVPDLFDRSPVFALAVPAAEAGFAPVVEPDAHPGR